MTKKPNVVIITCHDVGKMFSCLGDVNVSTPNIDKIASEGVLFTNYFAACPLCSPSRAGFITGMYPHSNGMNGLTHRGFALKDDKKVLAEYFNDAGYFTGLFGIQHESSDSSRLKYQYAEETHDPSDWLDASMIAGKASAFIDRYEDERPFMLSVGFKEGHRPFDQTYPDAPAPESLNLADYMWDSEAYREDLSVFYGMIKEVDYAVGIMEESLRKNGLEQETIFVFTSDHGIAFPRAKSTLYDPGIGIVFAIRYPGIFKEGLVTSALAGNVDFIQSMAPFCGLRLSGQEQGVSFAEVLTGGNASPRTEIFAEKSYHGNEYDPMRCIRTERFKLIKNFVPGYLWQLPMDMRTGRIGVEGELKRKKRRPMAEFYDLEIDPNETRNLIDDPLYQDEIKRLTKKLEDWMTNTNDPVMDGVILWPDVKNEYYANNRFEQAIFADIMQQQQIHN